MTKDKLNRMIERAKTLPNELLNQALVEKVMYVEVVGDGKTLVICRTNGGTEALKNRFFAARVSEYNLSLNWVRYSDTLESALEQLKMFELNAPIHYQTS
tara:strand:+ start:19271 stop:19570 length:300 start_codon:yes stop_codon:yes gene_type:complete